MTLKARVIRHFTVGAVVYAALLFLPAGSLLFWQGWLYLVVTLGFLLPASLYMVKRDPQLTERRMQVKEKEPKQMVFKTLLGLIGFSAIVLAGLDFRLGWTRAWLGPVPLAVVLVAQAAMLAGYYLGFWSMKVNTFAARTIQVEAGQTVISSGPYAIVRHPMYSGIALFALAAPLALGSCVAWLVFVWVIPLLALRLLDEENVLRRELAGYVEYCQRTRFRLMP
jgi:protein-S-isoprenylcysteine O-methyltransferase Ste14